MRKSTVISICGIFFLFFFPYFVLAGTVRLTWTGSTEADLVGYRVYYGMESRVYYPPISVDKVTEHIVTDLDVGKTYYFAITAVDSSGNESGFSGEVAKAAYDAPASGGGPFAITNLATASGKTYVIVEGIVNGSSRPYIDRSYVFSGVPEPLLTAHYIQTANNDKGVVDDAVVSFDVNREVTVYVGHDDRITEPAWLSAFTKTEDKFNTYRSMSVYRKDFPAGNVKLSGNGSGGSMYAVLVAAKPDTVAPSIAITSPTGEDTFAAGAPAMMLAGVASDDGGLDRVTWTRSRGDGGAADGTDSWSVSGIVLSEGEETFTVTSFDLSGNQASDSVVVGYFPDSEAPSIEITSPTTASSYTSAEPSIDLSGGASDNIGVKEVRWENFGGGSGVAAGTNPWTVSGVALFEGINLIEVAAIDEAGNRGTSSVSIEYEAPVFIPDPEAGLVSNPVTASGKAYEVLEGLTDRVSFCYSDRTYPYYNVPAFLSGATYIRTANNDRGVAGDAVLSFDVSGGVTVYVAHDNRITTKPSWLAGFTDSGYDLRTYKDMSLYQKDYPAGKVTLGANGSGGSMYTVIVVGKAGSVAPSISITSPTADTAFTTALPAIDLAGTAADDVGVTAVRWKNAAGGEGTATGTATWSIAGIALVEGENAISVTAEDESGNAATSTLNVVYAVAADLPLAITNLETASGRVYVAVEGLTDRVSPCYSDRSYAYGKVPAHLYGERHIQTANNDRGVAGEAVMGFDVNREVTVYVAHDDRIVTKPSWLAEFTDSGYGLTTYRDMTLYQRDYPAGRVTLGANGSGGSMYTVIVVER